MKPKLIAVVGPTGCGKSALGIALARQFNGEVINADSRALYRGFDIGTAKPAGDSSAFGGRKGYGLKKTFVVEGITHHLIDVVSADEEYNLGLYKQDADTCIRDIVERGATPILVGGTMQYVDAVVHNWHIPEVQPNKTYRARLEKKTLRQLQALLKKVDPQTWKIIDRNNPRRLIRALEVVKATGESFVAQRKKGKPQYDTLVIGIEVPREKLYKRLDDRTDAMIAAGLEQEVKKLAKKYPWQCPAMSGIGYREWRPFFEGTLPKARVIEQIKNDNHAYVRRQMTWFLKMKNVRWVRTPLQAKTMVKKFLT